MRRALAGVALVLIVIAFVVVIVDSRRSDRSLANVEGESSCVSDTRNLLAAQSVPTASQVPCLTSFPDGWEVTDEDYARGSTRVRHSVPEVPGATVEMTFRETCEVPERSSASTSGELTVHDRTDRTGGAVHRVQVVVFEGGCVESVVDVPGRIGGDAVLEELDESFRLVPRRELNAEVQHRTEGNLTLDP